MITLRYDDPDWCEREYNPRVTVPDLPGVFGRWLDTAAAARERLPHQAGIAYGADPRETLDLFRADRPRGAVVFIHGGYWRASSKDEVSWAAAALVPAGFTTLVLNYPLCPQVTIAGIADCCRRAVAFAWANLLDEAERRCLIASGHSAGGYLTASMLATDWAVRGLPAAPFAGGVSISGVFDLRPLLRTSMNELIRLTPEQAQAWSLHEVPEPRPGAPLELLVGGDETAEFHRQSALMAAAWPTLTRTPVPVPGRHHFDVVEEIGRPGTPVFDAVLRLAR
ncbi:alpha/beta hydrolase [Inquilinus limosus]|uniref:alpha/beta hydrolase n=1 Tax=Inquilinus limosus TaxID=171674 RepID=UPI00041D8029|nr:alpha/beta hydrolase [Inquilinus limosus]